MMNLFIKNTNVSISVSLTALRLVGFWEPDGLNLNGNRCLYRFYTCFSFMFLLGTYLIIQSIDLFMIWGNLPMMTATAFVLFTNISQAVKIVNLFAKRELVKKIIADADEVLKKATGEGQEIVKRCNRETRLLQLLYFGLTLITTTGWAASAEKGMLPLRAWYPYDTSKTPAYELTYLHQVGAINIAAFLNICKDTLVSSLIAQCRCRLRLLRWSLSTLCRDLELSDKLVFTPQQEEVAADRLRACIEEHQSALDAALQIQTCFSLPTFLQFMVSLIIICVTAFQLISQTGNLVRLLSMGTYLLNMMYQVFIYCYQGHHLSEESAEVAGAAYECPWYACSVPLRKSLLIVMTRTRRVARITAGGFTTLSLASFMAIIKASYSLFTLLQQVTEKN